MPCEITQDSFGKTKDGKEVKRFTLKNSSGSLEVKVIEYGAIITEIHVPDRNGKMVDINLAFDEMTGYESGNPEFGAVVGRVANVTAGCQFTLDGKTYSLFKNRPTSSCHGGQRGFADRLWSGKVEGDKLVLKYVSADGEEGYPGELTTTVSYRVTDDNQLTIEYEAITTKPTPVNLTNHSYFNLAGHNAGTMDDHVVTIAADHFLPIDKDGVPTGEIGKVEGTEWDLRKPVRLGDRLHKVPGGEGFCHNFCLTPNEGSQLRFAARVEHPASGRSIECWTTEPGLQFYNSYYLNQPKGKGGAAYTRFGAFCLEAQHYPNSLHEPSFPNIILRPAETYRQTTVYKFGAV
ncbi:galactose mutarotase-like [Littorina saxatilis]|uniref:galactose mutarotase-like n=1 Tax=Littorina saxatilis TaxID=31220 RepID=UPI0038B41C1B